MSHATTTTVPATKSVTVKSQPKAQPTKVATKPVETKTAKVQDPKALKLRLQNVVSKKEPNDLHKQYAAWIKAQTGFSPDLKTVQVLLASYHDFQASPEKQQAMIAAKAKIQKDNEAKTEAAKARLLAQAKKLGLTL